MTKQEKQQLSEIMRKLKYKELLMLEAMEEAKKDGRDRDRAFFAGVNNGLIFAFRQLKPFLCKYL